MKTILFMRHAKSDWGQADLSDHDRPLNERGRRVAPAMGQYLCQHNLVPEMVIVSTARRAQETLELMLPHWPTQPKAISQRGLYMATGRAFYLAIADVPNQVQHVMVIGHNPGMTALAGMFDRTSTHFPTAAVLYLRSLKADWAEIAESTTNSEFVSLLKPKALGLDSSSEDD
ncbi:MAG: histidine phosphatase family protein [Pirellulaceae bacterium]